MKGMPLMEESSIDYRSFSLGAFLCLLILTATLGNLLVCIAVVTEKSLRKLSNLFFVSLAVSDLLVGAMVMPLALVNDLSSWKFGQDFCKLWIASDVMCSTASILNLMAISFDRLGGGCVYSFLFHKKLICVNTPGLVRRFCFRARSHPLTLTIGRLCTLFTTFPRKLY